MTQKEMIVDLSRRVRRLEEDMALLKGQVPSTGVTPMEVSSEQLKEFFNRSTSESINTDDMPSEQVAAIMTSAIPQSHKQPQCPPQNQTAAIHRTYGSPTSASVKKPETSSKNFEQKIGKNLMGVAASVLIFFSLILFGGLLFSYITDTIKFAIMLILSIGFLAVGLIKMDKRSKYYVLFSSIAGCGAGAFYISCLIGYFGFHLLNDFTLVMCLAIWLLLTIVLSRVKSKMFLYISNVGLILATILVSVNWPALSIGILLYFIGIIALYVCNSNREYNYDSLFFIQIPIVSAVLACIYYTAWIDCLLLVVLSGLFIFQICYYDLSKTRYIGTNLISLISTVICQLIITFRYSADLIRYDWIAYLIFIMCCLTYGVVIYVKHLDNNKPLSYVWTGLFVVTTLLPFIEVLDAIPSDIKIIGYWPYIIFFLVLGLVKRNAIFRCLSYVCIFMNTVYLSSQRVLYNNAIVMALSFIVIAMIMLGVVIWLRDNYSLFDKYCLTALLLYLIFFGCSVVDDCPGWIPMVIYTLVSLAMNSRLFRNSLNGQHETSSEVIGYVFNAIVMICATVFISESDETLYLIVGLLCAAALYCINVKHIFTTSLPENLCGVYTAFKFTILLLVVLNHFDAVSFIISIACLLLAIASIVVGFYTRIKSFRIYGLVLTLISVIKLLLFDIEYGSDILRPVGFFVAGVLCFVISWIYSRLEKQLSDESVSNQ